MDQVLVHFLSSNFTHGVALPETLERIKGTWLEQAFAELGTELTAYHFADEGTIHLYDKTAMETNYCDRIFFTVPTDTGDYF